MSVDLEPLYRAPLAAWVAERKALAATVKAAGDRDGAAAIGKLARPTPAAWAANQLWFHARALFDRLIEITRALGRGDLTAAGEQRAALAALKARAVELCAAIDQPASDAMLAKLDTNLRALAAHGWGDVAPGQLAVDLPPPGFDAMSEFSLVAAAPTPPPPPAPAPPPRPTLTVVPSPDDAEARRRAEAEAARAAAARAEAQAAYRRRAERVTAARAAERAAQTRAAEAAAALALVRAELDRAELAVADARARAAAAEREVAAAEAALGEPPA
ncbi:MAG: hypothetical protein JNK64_31760 [Myxococcales bacterium]|nr:hypothetical protein [Myxococcales bacterium]